MPYPPRPAFPRVELSGRYFLEAYFGWSVVSATRTWKLLQRRRLGLSQRMLVSSGASHTDLAGALSGSPIGLVDVLWNDFSAAEDDAPDVELGGRLFGRNCAERWFGAGTYAFDLSLDDDALLARANQSLRSKVRSTRRAGFTAEMLARPSRTQVDEFAGRYAAMARERSLPPLDRAVIDAMFQNGDAALARSIDPAGVPRVWNVVYFTDTHGYYLYGVNDRSVKETGGQQLQMATLAYTRSRGRAYYDLGLVGSTGDGDGIQWFKRSFGGTFLPSGTERNWRNALIARVLPRARALRARLWSLGRG